MTHHVPSPLTEAGHTKHLVITAESPLSEQLPFFCLLFVQYFPSIFTKTKAQRWVNLLLSLPEKDRLFFHIVIHVKLWLTGDAWRRRPLFLSWRILSNCEVCRFSRAGKWLGSPWLLVWWSFWWLQWACSWGCSWAWGRKTPLPPRTTSTRRLLWLLMPESVQKWGGKKTLTL